MPGIGLKPLIHSAITSDISNDDASIDILCIYHFSLFHLSVFKNISQLLLNLSLLIEDIDLIERFCIPEEYTEVLNANTSHMNYSTRELWYMLIASVHYILVWCSFYMDVIVPNNYYWISWIWMAWFNKSIHTFYVQNGVTDENCSYWIISSYIFWPSLVTL